MGAVPVEAAYPGSAPARAARAAAAGYLARRYGVSLDPEAQIVLTTGSKEATVLVPLLTVDRGSAKRGVLIPVPSYASTVRGALLAGAEVIPVPLRAPTFTPIIWELPPKQLSRSAVLWLNSPHNPTGAVMSREDLARTAAVCREFGIRIASDELYADIYQNQAPSGILEVSGDDVLAVQSLSKRAGFTGIGAGFVAGDPAVIARYRKLRDSYGAAPSDMVNAAAAVAWADDSFAEAARAVHARRKSRLRAMLEGCGLEVLHTDATFYLWVRAPRGLTGLAFARALAAQGLLVQPSDWFGGDAHDWVRFAAVFDEPEGALPALHETLEK